MTGPKKTITKTFRASDPNADRDQRLADILDDLSVRAAQGEQVDLEEQTRRHPDLADELRQLWGAVMLANAVGSQSQVSVADVEQRQPRSSPFDTIELPYRFGDYELQEEIGRGGMGVVYRAHQISLGRRVAVKLLLRGQLASQSDQARFQAEAEAAAKLDHQNIVPVYDVGEHNGHAFFSMKYVEGETLADRLKGNPLPGREAAELLAKVAHAIDYAHENGVLHRDLKPSNILIDRAGIPHVSDFGLAKQFTDAPTLTRTGAVLGTPAYMSPEQAAGNRGEIGVTSDVYSLGTILYHMITGKPPFDAKTPMEIVFQVLEEDPPLPRVLNPHVDRTLEMVALHCLQKPPDLRYSSARGLAEDLEAYLGDEPLVAQSGRISQVVARLFRETHHAAILENWGLLWMWHSLVLLTVCLLTNVMVMMGNQQRWHYFLMWTAGLGSWAGVFWALRRRMGPVTFVERQIAHAWAASLISIVFLFIIEVVMGLPVLKLAPVLALAAGMVFIVKAGILSGSFYVQAAALFVTAVLMAIWQDYAHVIFGVVAAACFFLPGWKYYRRARRA